MTETEFLHDALNKLTVPYYHLVKLRDYARAHINDEGAIDVRDFCEDLVYRIDMFTREKQIAEKFSKPEEVV